MDHPECSAYGSRGCILGGTSGFHAENLSVNDQLDLLVACEKAARHMIGSANRSGHVAIENRFEAVRGIYVLARERKGNSLTQVNR